MSNAQSSTSPGRNIVLGVTGSIAAHRALDLASQFTKDGYSVHVAMTADAQRFVTPLADDALTCIALALTPTAKILIAPAMNGKMWQHPATQANVATLKARGVEFIGPDEGLLSCGYEGVGRLAPLEQILERARALLNAPR